MKFEKAIITSVLAIGMISCTSPKQGDTTSSNECQKTTGEIVVDLNKSIRPIGLHNGINSAPGAPSSYGAELWQAAEIPFARTHDLNTRHGFGWPYVIDVSSIFRNFDADETKPENYDFACTDALIKNIVASRSRVFYRLGCMNEEHLAKKYTIFPPKDNAKWARICERIIAHYNEGWAKGFKYNIKYWEIWNEPNLRKGGDDPENGVYWRGTRDQFKDFFKVAVKHLKTRFPNLKIGGPAVQGPGIDWCEEIIKEFAEEKIPLDFYSWHGVAKDPRTLADDAAKVRAMLDKYGFEKCESVLSEWHYEKAWQADDFNYSVDIQTGRFNQKSSAFIAAGFCVLQNSSVDFSLFFNAPSLQMNNLFMPITGLPSRGYYTFVAWRDLRRLGTQVKATTDLDDMYVTAAKNDKGDWGLLLARFSPDNSATETTRVRISLASKESLAGAKCHLSDDVRVYTKTDMTFNEDGSASLFVRPNSYAFISFKNKKK